MLDTDYNRLILNLTEELNNAKKVALRQTYGMTHLISTEIANKCLTKWFSEMEHPQLPNEWDEVYP